jgi:hypothetical protein
VIRRLLVPIVLLLAAALPREANAQDYTWTLSLLGGVGGSLDKGGSAGFGGQLGAALHLERTHTVWVRGGRFGFDTGADAGSLADATVTYLDLGGEYQFHEGYYESGLFLGLGAYQLEGTELGVGGVPRDVLDDTVIGLVLGASGEFKFSPSFAFLVEISGHVVDSDAVGVLGMGHAGFALHF